MRGSPEHVAPEDERHAESRQHQARVGPPEVTYAQVFDIAFERLHRGRHRLEVTRDALIDVIRKSTSQFSELIVQQPHRGFHDRYAISGQALGAAYERGSAAPRLTDTVRRSACDDLMGLSVPAPTGQALQRGSDSQTHLATPSPLASSTIDLPGGDDESDDLENRPDNGQRVAGREANQGQMNRHGDTLPWRAGCRSR